MKQFVAFLLLSAVAFAEPPKPVIDGPTERQPGALTFLDASKSTADKWTWLVDTSAVAVPKDGTPDVSQTVTALRAMGFDVQEPADESEPLWAVSEDGKRLWLSSFPGVYAVTLGVSNADGVALLPWKVKVSGEIPIPVPVPVPIPTPTPTPTPVPDDFSTLLTNAVKAVPEAHAEFAGIANVYAGIAEQIKAGSILLTTPAQVTGLTSVMVAHQAQMHAADWKKIDDVVVQPHLKTLTLVKVADYEPVWRQVAAAVKAGLTDTPPPDVVPIPVTSLHVLMIWDRDQMPTLPASQVGIHSSTALRKWFTENNVQWRQFYSDSDPSSLDAKWKAAWDVPRESLPWIVASDGSTKSFKGPMPKTETELIQLLEKYK